MKYTYIQEVFVTDPDSQGDVHLEVWKDNESGGIFAIDASFLEQLNEFYNPFNGDHEETATALPDNGVEQDWMLESL